MLSPDLLDDLLWLLESLHTGMLILPSGRSVPRLRGDLAALRSAQMPTEEPPAHKASYGAALDKVIWERGAIEALRHDNAVLFNNIDVLQKQITDLRCIVESLRAPERPAPEPVAALLPPFLSRGSTLP